jgi:hypothetical protein
MNRKIGVFSSAINVVAVIGFALAMLIGSNFGSYLSSMFIAFSFMPMMCAYAYFSSDKTKLAGIIAAGFAAMYAICNLLVYFTQITTVRMDTLTEQAAKLLDFQSFGLFFNYDMLGYCLMAIATFFAGLTVAPQTKADQWLKWLLLIHGVFAISCFILPLLGLFSPDLNNGEWIGTAILIFWCVYFIPIGILSCFYFSKHED